MTRPIKITRLPYGYWHARGDGAHDYAQWAGPLGSGPLGGDYHPEASGAFVRGLRDLLFRLAILNAARVVVEGEIDAEPPGRRLDRLRGRRARLIDQERAALGWDESMWSEAGDADAEDLAEVLP